MSTEDRTEAACEPSRICEIETADDREFHVVPGDGCSQNGRN